MDKPRKEDFPNTLAYARAVAKWKREGGEQPTGAAAFAAAVAEGKPEEPAPKPEPPPVLVKKGKPVWGGQAPLMVRLMDPDKHYVWGMKDETEMERYADLGLKPCQGIGGQATRGAGGESVHDGKPLTTVKTFRELVLLEMPQELREAQLAFMDEQAMDQVRGLEQASQEQFKQRTGGKLPVRASFRIS